MQIRKFDCDHRPWIVDFTRHDRPNFQFSSHSVHSADSVELFIEMYRRQSTCIVSVLGSDIVAGITDPFRGSMGGNGWNVMQRMSSLACKMTQQILGAICIYILPIDQNNMNLSNLDSGVEQLASPGIFPFRKPLASKRAL